MSAPLSEQQLAEIRAREAAATKGPWKAMVIDADVTTIWAGGSTVRTAIRVGRVVAPADADFITATREDVPALLAEVERLKGRVAEMEKDSALLNALEVAGVDNWEGYDDACEGL